MREKDEQLKPQLDKKCTKIYIYIHLCGCPHEWLNGTLALEREDYEKW